MGRRTVVSFVSAAVFLMSGVFGTARGGTERLSAYLVDLMESNDGSYGAFITLDGRYVAFASGADNLVPGDTNGVEDAFVHDRTTGQITRVSVDSTGMEGNGDSRGPAISADGHYVAFQSDADDLVPGDANGVADVFVRDRTTGQTFRVSVDSAGIEGNGGSGLPGISADGRYVAFDSYADNLVPGDTNGVKDVFVHDRTTGQTFRVNVHSSGIEGNGLSDYSGAISADGRYVAFDSYADNLVAGDTNLSRDVFVHDCTTGQTFRVSADSAGIEGNGGSGFPAISADGRFVAFSSAAGNLVGGDANGQIDIFVHDRATGQTFRVSVDSAGIQGNGGSILPAISADGRYVAFDSAADNLVPGDTNGVVDTFVHDRTTGQTTRVSVDSSGTEGSEGSGFWGEMSADGRYVAFDSYATNLVAGDTNGVQDVFLHDRTTGQTTRVSEYLTLVEGDHYSYEPAVSFDGRYVAFDSSATNLVAGDTNGKIDVFVHDRQTGTITRASVDSGGVQGNSHSQYPSISGDGRFVAFSSAAGNLVGGDANGQIDIFVHDRTYGGTTRVSVSSMGTEGNGGSYFPAVSADGRWVAFHSDAGNLVSGDLNGVTDVFVHDLDTAQTFRVSVDSNSVEGNSYSRLPSISRDGQLIAFESYATNLVPGDTNGWKDVFVHDQATGETTRLSVDSAGTQANRDSANPSISEDGRYVAFESNASNLVANDTNGVGDIFVHDLDTGQTARASVESSGLQAYADSLTPSIAKDGRYVAFASSADSLVSDDTNSAWDVFVHDLTTGQTARVSLDSLGVEGNDNSRYPAFSADGRYIAFNSDADNLVPNDTNTFTDVFVVENAPAMPCEGVLLDIADRTYHSGETVVCRGYVTLSAGLAVEVGCGADVTYSAPTVALRSGFRVLEGGTFRAGYDPLATPTSFRVRGSAAVRSAGTVARGKHPERDPSEKGIANSRARRIGLAELPHDLLDALRARGGDPAALHHMLADADGDLVVFVSDRDILDGDANGLSDVYAYETATGRLTLVSRTLWGSAGNGASTSPAVDGPGGSIVFQSDASDLIASDRNGVTDIFLFDTVARSVLRVTDFYLFEDGLESPSAHPSIDAAGATVLFDRVDEGGYRQIHGYEFHWPTAQTLSLREDDAGLRTDNHHPTISADGRYVAYVETTASDLGNECRVHFYDRQTGDFERVGCPDELRAAREEAAPYFADDAGQVEWHLRGWYEPVITRNPLVE